MYEIIRTDTADTWLRKIILYVALSFGKDLALKKLNGIEDSIMTLADNPYLGAVPSYPTLKRQGYRVLILEKDLIFYKVDETKKRLSFMLS